MRVCLWSRAAESGGEFDDVLADASACVPCRTKRESRLHACAGKRRNPTFSGWGFWLLQGSLTITYFHTGNPHYHRRGVVSRSCSGWEGVVPTRYGHQA